MSIVIFITHSNQLGTQIPIIHGIGVDITNVMVVFPKLNLSLIDTMYRLYQTLFRESGSVILLERLRSAGLDRGEQGLKNVD